ncbi:MAG: hypothetical protein J6D29_09090 [Solobacterium sp.]|nr:hypothetical protein [Solobacterium sp.]
MKCPYCGSENAEKAIKCTSCHALLVTDNGELLDSLAAPAAVTVGNAQAQVQPKVEPPVVETEVVKEKPNQTQQFIEQREKERAKEKAARPTYTQSRPAASQDNDKVLGVLSYIFVLVALVTYFLKRDNMSPLLKTHLNQAVVLHVIAWVAQIIPVFGSLISLAAFAAMIYGIYCLVKGSDEEIPYIGQIKLFK